LVFGIGLVLIGLGFKTSLVPFHQWTPDVYQGAPTNVTAFMAAGAKIGAFAALWRVLEGCLPMADFWMPALFWIAILTMTVGNLIAVVQKDVKRILAYSSIAHAGYILVAILAHFRAPDRIGATTVTYYLLSYTLMTVGAFAVVSMSTRKGQEDTRLESLHGLRTRSPLAAAALTLFMLSLIGMPPTAGFFGKAMIFMDALNAGLLPLAIVLAVNSVISIYYYLGIVVAAMVSEEDSGAKANRFRVGPAGATLLCSVGILAIAIWLAPLSSVLAIK
jgi:NADH-quinone oxidoreductase subunit N